jgi:hypothetical protein
MKRVTIELDKEETKILEKRAKKNLFSLKEQVEDIVRRSCVSASSGSTASEENIDDRLVSVFSRVKRGKKK